MQRQLIALGALILLGSAPLSAAANVSAAQRLAQGVGECASVTASVRMQAVGYNHIVTLANHCEHTVTCEVWTNVDPAPHVTLQARPGTTAETITRVGSPSRDVHASELCHFDG
jgi:hypothetical protein